jgi:putative endopeptidase
MSSELHRNDFYEAVNQEWLQSTRLPDSHSRYGQFDILHKHNTQRILSILQNTDNQILASLFNTAMNLSQSTDTIDVVSNYITAINDNLLGQSLIDGYSSILSFNVMSDLKNDQLEVIYINEPSLSLPNKHYYSNPKYKHFYDAYVKYVHDTVKKYNLPISPSNVINIESSLAELSMSKEEKRNIESIYNPFSIAQLQQIYNIQPFINAIKKLVPNIQYSSKVIVTNTKLLQHLDKINNLEDFVKWTIYNTSLPFINQETETHHWNFYGKVLSGLKEMKPQNERILALISNLMGDLLGYQYGQKYFTFAVSDKIYSMIQHIKETMQIKLSNLSWMSEPTKKHALTKLQNMKYKIGVPFKIKDYSDLQLSGNLLNMIRQISQHSLKTDLSNLEKKPDPDLWEIGAHEVNAYYSLVKNEIVFPVGILQPPFFSVDASEETNYGAIGAIIGHEISHGFDDQGKKFDADGKLHNWWCAQDKEKYQKEAQKIIDQFNNIVEDGHKMNGKLTLGENLADLCGLTISLHTILRIKPSANLKEFFESYARLWRQIIRKEEILKRIKSDPHSLAKHRVNQTLRNIPEFYSTYNISPNDNMYLHEDLRAKLI